MILKVILCLYLHLYFWGSTKVLNPHLRAKALLAKFIPRGLAPNCPMKDFLSGTKFKKANRQKGGKGKTEAHWKYLGGTEKGSVFRRCKGLSKVIPIVVG